LPEGMIRDIVLMKLNAVGLRGARHLMPSEVSGGMARRVALARAIALDPELVMYDEPFSGLDPISLGTAARLIRQLNDSMGLTSIFVSHELEETFAIADHVIILANGKIATQGKPEDVRHKQDPLVSQYVHAGQTVRYSSSIPGHPWRRILACRQRRSFRCPRVEAGHELVPPGRCRLWPCAHNWPIWPGARLFAPAGA
jgi:ABC-type transporter Mla maintaining outer membrane lipid asymmetry ATPase subunit MlaF